MSTLADALKTMANASRKGKRQVVLHPSSKVLVKFLTCMQKHGYINEFEIVDDHRGGKIVVELNGRLNKCGIVSPRYNMALPDIDEFTTYLLPSRQFGFVVMTTSLGIMVCILFFIYKASFTFSKNKNKPKHQQDHEEARRKRTGGKVLGFFY